MNAARTLADVWEDERKAEANNLGPLTDPTPSERALSLLRLACNAIGFKWPQTEDTSLAIVIVEDRTLLMAIYHRCRGEPEKGARCDDVAKACWWTHASLLFAKRGDRPAELRYEARAAEHLTWVSQYKGPTDGQ